MAMEPLYTMVAGGALETNGVFNVKCNCGGIAPLTPKSVRGYGFGKRGCASKVVDTLETVCETCGTTIKVVVLEGDPGYVLTSKAGADALVLPQGSTGKPVSQLTPEEHVEIIRQIKDNMGA